jgi:hypothetical protein
MGINTATKNFRDNVLKSINESGLPACVLELVLDNILGAVRQKVAMDLQAEAESEVAKDAESVQPD